MEEKEPVALQVRAQEFAKKNLLFVSLVLIGALLIGIGIFQYFKPQSNGIEFVSGSLAGSDPAEEVKGVSSTKISIDIEGSVQKPGVYILPEGSRVKDALVASGGLSSNADREYVSRKINLAQKLIDSAKIYIPAVGEVPSAGSGGVQPLLGVEPLNDASSKLVSINSASQSELESLPKIGPVTAQKIISGRPYTDISELVSKKILTQKTFDAIKDLISAE